MSDHQKIGAMANLPHELIVDILSRLPSKSLCRFRCVSKTWFSLTYHPHFAKLHLNQNHRHKEKPMLISDSLYELEYEESLLSSENGAVAVELIFPDLRRVDGWPEILGSCNGLLLVGNEYDDRRFLLNPSIGECRELPKSPFDGKYTVNSDDCFCMYGLGYDSLIDDYKIIRIFCNFTDENFFEVIFSVYNLRTDSWRRIEDYPYDHWYGEQPPAALLNGALHWSALSRGSDHWGTIASFDLVNEKFQDLAPPSFVQDPDLHGLGVLGGCLAMLVSTDSGYDVCVMKKYGVKESWTKFSMAHPDKYLDPVCFPRNGEVVWKEDNKLTLYNPNEETYREVEISGVSKFVAGMTYVESLVSPNYYNGIDTDRASETRSDIDSNQCWRNWENYLKFKRECRELFKYNEKLLEVLQSCTAPNDVSAQTTGEDRHGCACTSGLGVSPSNICGSRATLSEAIRMSEIEKAQKIAYEQRKSAVLEELLAVRRKLIKMMRGFSFSIKEESHSSSESDSQ